MVKVFFQEPNTFQGILLTDGRQSFAVFTYECGLLGWSTGAVVGFTGEGGFYGNHPLSVKGLVLESTSNIDCQSPYRWNNVIFNLSPLSNLNGKTQPEVQPSNHCIFCLFRCDIVSAEVCYNRPVHILDGE